MGKRYDHLTVDERNEIHRCLNRGLSLRAIARGLDRPPSAVSREVRRNAVGRHYDAGRARCRRGSRKLRVDAPLFAEVRALMNQGWSPQQVAGRLRRMHSDEPPWQVSHETIYCALYALPRGALRKELIAALRKAHQHRRPRTRGTDRRGILPNIHGRPSKLRRGRCRGSGRVT